ncbi:MAG: 1-acyl-sn-glycerol-3-phosphate acyltransferase, partial [Gluconacetobacter diazotrophicus]|nr:1-acyl-sn-glycerol-3-phosphate acyltransferase [Gluconacetobacter diazotrophicus]
MQAAPRSLGPRAKPALPARPGLLPFQRAKQAQAFPADDRERALPPPSRPLRLVRALRVARRAALVVGWTGLACSIQSVLLLLPGRGKASFARFYWHVCCLILGMRVRVVGEDAGTAHRSRNADARRRPLIYVCNHSSWIDVPVLGGRLLACFVAKEEVGKWPVVGSVARLGRTLFVSRQRRTTGRERDDMRLRLLAGDDLILFPEGTSSDGSRVLPFHSSFFSAAFPNGSARDGEPTPLIQPVSVVYDRLGGLPVGRASRTLFSWYGDMDLASHFARFARLRGMRATI